MVDVLAYGLIFNARIVGGKGIPGHARVERMAIVALENNELVKVTRKTTRGV